MIVSILEISALVLGLAIAINTIAAGIQTYIVGDRKRHAVLGAVENEIKSFTRLASVMGARADRIRKGLKDEQEDVMQPGPIDQDLQKDIDWTLARVDHVLELRRHWDVESVAPYLNRKQRAAFLTLVDSYDLYCDRLDIRTREFRVAPQAHGALARLIACTQVDLSPSLRDAGQNFAKTIAS